MNFGADLVRFQVARCRRGISGEIIFESIFHFFAALIRLRDRFYFLAVVERHYVGHFGAIRELIDAGHFRHGSFYDWERDFFRVGALWNLEGGVCAISTLAAAAATTKIEAILLILFTVLLPFSEADTVFPPRRPQRELLALQFLRRRRVRCR